MVKQSKSFLRQNQAHFHRSKTLKDGSTGLLAVTNPCVLCTKTIYFAIIFGALLDEHY